MGCKFHFHFSDCFYRLSSSHFLFLENVALVAWFVYVRALTIFVASIRNSFHVMSASLNILWLKIAVFLAFNSYSKYI